MTKNSSKKDSSFCGATAIDALTACQNETARAKDAHTNFDSRTVPTCDDAPATCQGRGSSCCQQGPSGEDGYHHRLVPCHRYRCSPEPLGDASTSSSLFTSYQIHQDKPREQHTGAELARFTLEVINDVLNILQEDDPFFDDDGDFHTAVAAKRCKSDQRSYCSKPLEHLTSPHLMIAVALRKFSSDSHS